MRNDREFGLNIHFYTNELIFIFNIFQDILPGLLQTIYIYIFRANFYLTGTFLCLWCSQVFKLAPARDVRILFYRTTNTGIFTW